MWFDVREWEEVVDIDEDGPADFGGTGERDERLTEGDGEGEGLLSREMEDNLSKAY